MLKIGTEESKQEESESISECSDSDTDMMAKLGKRKAEEYGDIDDDIGNEMGK